VQTPLRVVALLPIITPPFVVGLGLILLFGRAGRGQPVPGIRLRHPAHALVLRGVGHLDRPDVRLHADRLHDHARRGAGRGSPAWKRRRRRCAPTAARPSSPSRCRLLKPGLANAFLVGFIESMADFGNPIVVGGQYSVLSTDIFFAIVGAQYDQGRAASLAWILTLFALGVFALQRGLLGKQNYTTVSGKGDAGIPMPLPDSVRRVLNAVVYPWLAFTVVVYLFAFAGGFVQTWGRDYTLTLNHFKTAFALEWGQFGLVWAGTAWNSLFTTSSWPGCRRRSPPPPAC
jgi:iron(III) transport system permease protein